jgi:hypothetical protein
VTEARDSAPPPASGSTISSGPSIPIRSSGAEPRKRNTTILRTSLSAFPARRTKRVGGNRGLWALRVPFEHLGARLYPDMFSLAQAHNAFTGDGRIANEQLHERFEANIANFMDLVEAAKHYPCVKRAWVEYLGEHRIRSSTESSDAGCEERAAAKLS